MTEFDLRPEHEQREAHRALAAKYEPTDAAREIRRLEVAAGERQPEDVGYPDCDALQEEQSFMVTVEVLVPSSLDLDDIATEIETAVENELPGPLDLCGYENRDELQLEVGCVGSIDPGLIDDGIRYRRSTATPHPLAAALIGSRYAVAQAALENRGELERAVRACYAMDGTTENAEGIQAIVDALDEWHDASVAVLQAESETRH